jgi:osmotically-inducible protein OsmY
MTKLDSELAIALNSKLERDQRTADSPLEAIDDNGVVTLSGVALSNEARAAAAEICIDHPGVLSVINDLEVDPDATTEIKSVVPLPVDPAYQHQV